MIAGFLCMALTLRISAETRYCLTVLFGGMFYLALSGLVDMVVVARFKTFFGVGVCAANVRAHRHCL